MACSTLGRAQGRSLLPEAPAPERIALLSGAQQIFGSIRDQQLYRKDQLPARLPLLSGVLFSPASGGAVVTPAGRSPSFPLKPVQVGWWPVTATHHWRSGPRGPAKMAPSPAAANTSSVARLSPAFCESAVWVSLSFLRVSAITLPTEFRSSIMPIILGNKQTSRGYA